MFAYQCFVVFSTKVGRWKKCPMTNKEVIVYTQWIAIQLQDDFL